MRCFFILLSVGTLLLSPCKITQAQEVQTLDNPVIETRAASFPNRIEITVRISAHEDLKIAKDMAIAKGQIISDRILEKERLLAQKKQLELSLKRVQLAKITKPSKPLLVPEVAPLPPANYLEFEAAIAKAKLSVESATEEVNLKKQEISELSAIDGIDPIIIEHEQMKLKELELNHQIALNELELAKGKLETAKQQRKYQEYQASINAARRVEEQNQAKSFYQRQLAEYNEKVAKKEIQITQLQEKLNNVQSQIDNLQILSPYAGQVRSIEFLGQDAEGLITVKILLKISGTPELPK